MITRTCYACLYVLLQYACIACAVEYPIDSSTGKITYTEVVTVDSSINSIILVTIQG